MSPVEQRPRLDGTPPIRARWLLAFLAALAVPGAGQAADEVARADDPCADDVRQFCSDVKPGSSRLVDCLQSNRSRLSAACGARIDASRQKARAYIEEFGRSCRVDVDRHCPGVDPGGGRIVGCLRQHQLELSKPCQGEITRIADARDRVASLKSALEERALARGL